MRSIMPLLEPYLRTVTRPARYINNEWGATYKADASYNFCMIYPDTYELGQANQALRILCNVINAQDDCFAQRAFLPDPEFCDILRKNKIPSFSLETTSPLGDFDCIGITLPHELAATNVLEILDLAGIPVRAEERDDTHPLIFAGGPCAFNPEPYFLFFDFFSIGEGEESVVEVCKLHKSLKEQGLSKQEILFEISKLKGIYVPGFYSWRSAQEAQEHKSWINPLREDIPSFFEKRLFDDFAASPAWEPCCVPFTEVVHDRLNVEILRGCTRGCRFCQAGMMYRPVRERSAQNIIDSVLCGLEQTGYDEVSLTSLSTTDHSQIAYILETLNKKLHDKGVKLSIPSQRLDSFGVDMANLVAGRKKGGLTFAPEAGSQRMRDVINKDICEDDLFKAIDAAFAQGWRRIKLYFMIGLPGECDEDVIAIADLVQRSYYRAVEVAGIEHKGSIKVTASLALFVPKAQTPFQWDGQIPPDEALRRVRLVRSHIKSRAIDIHWHDPSTSFVEAVMSRGGRECAYWVEEAWKRGARFDAWTECFNETAWRDAAQSLGIDTEALAQKTYDTSYIMPWEHISTGVSRKYFALERRRANQEIITPDCSFESCTACGVCPKLDVDIITQEARLLP